MRSTSDEITYKEQNLWMIDERLAYHYYLASDKPLSTLDPVITSSKKEPDIIVFNNPISVVNDESKPYGNIVIIEFKRPMRKDTSDTKNPIDQVSDYIDCIREGKSLDRKGRPITVNPDSTQFYAYIICDYTPDMKTLCRKRGFTPTPDDMGCYFYNPNQKSYTEVISFDKLLQDARARNRVLFDKLNLA